MTRRLNRIQIDIIHINIPFTRIKKSVFTPFSRHYFFFFQHHSNNRYKRLEIAVLREWFREKYNKCVQFIQIELGEHVFGGFFSLFIVRRSTIFFVAENHVFVFKWIFQKKQPKSVCKMIRWTNEGVLKSDVNTLFIITHDYILIRCDCIIYLIWPLIQIVSKPNVQFIGAQ